MKLFYSPYACSLAPHIVLRELDLPFQLERVDASTRRTETGEDYLAINPKGYVPALRLDSGEILTEAPAIMQYLADAFAPDTLAPLSGSVERARLNGHLNYIAAELHKPLGSLFDGKMPAATRSAVTDVLQQRFSLIEQLLADGRDYLSGPDHTLADIYVFVVWNWAPMVGFEVAPFPKISALAKRIESRPAVQAALRVENE